MITRFKHLALLVMIVLLVAVPPLRGQTPTPEPPGPTLAAVLTRGQLICGVNGDIFGFGFLNPNTGDITGIHVDFCTAIAVAIFGDVAAVDYRLQPINTPPTSLLNGQVDVMLLHSLTRNLTEDSSTALQFGPFIFYDGQSVMVRFDSGIATWEDLSGETICTIAGTPAEANIQAEMQRRGLPFDLLTFDSGAAVQEAFQSGRCDAQTLERSLLEIRRQSTEIPADYVVWEQPFTRTGQGVLLRYGDKQWEAIVNWTLWGLIHAEELGINSRNVGEFVRREGETDEAYTARVGLPIAQFLDISLGTGSRLGLPGDFMVEVIRQVGNYAEIYNRHLGPESALPMTRGLNELWQNGGLLEAPPWR